jgi:hypothetical protein
MEVLRDHGGKVHPSEVQNDIGRRITLTPCELSLDNSGLPRFDRAAGFDTGYAATVGWTSKIGGWSLTDAGIEAMETYPEDDELWAEFNHKDNSGRHLSFAAQRRCADREAPVSGLRSRLAFR